MSEKKSYAKFARFSGLGVQMGVIIGGFAWLGNYLDKKQGNQTAWWTLGLTLFGVGSSLYLMIKEVIKMGKEDDKK